MIISVQTIHGAEFTRAGITFGPIPRLLWVETGKDSDDDAGKKRGKKAAKGKDQDGPPPGVPTISAGAYAAICMSSDRHQGGVLHVTTGPAIEVSAASAERVAAAEARLAVIEADIAAGEKRLAEVRAELAEANAQLDAWADSGGVTEAAK